MFEIYLDDLTKLSVNIQHRLTEQALRNDNIFVLLILSAQNNTSIIKYLILSNKKKDKRDNRQNILIILISINSTALNKL